MEYDQLARRLATILETVRPDVLVIPSATDGHPDHRALHQICVTAVKVRSQCVILGYKVWLVPEQIATSSAWQCGPLVLVGIDNERAIKDKAIRAHASQREGEYAAMARSLSRYLAIALRARGHIQSRHVEVFGVYQSGGGRRLDSLLELLEPAAIISERTFGVR